MAWESQHKERESLYERDYHLWILDTVQKLKDGNFQAVDWDHLIEEIADLSRREKRKLESLLTRLFEHLLKFRFWQDRLGENRGHWEAEILSFRKQIKRELKASPSLKNHLLAVWEECYQDGREIAAKRSQLPLETFPENPLGSVEQVLDENWLPRCN
ncbi:DUF29 domain-containing protein [Geitlerinema sp. PCC 9228]|jgi:PAS domain-containing protein|uniref:DUF29 domain-containing protein n=1 Tax=Geitlerinema sp. PCC 9228 TaxID=111611 RepID=UPI0008F996BC|nr:DUF29 domain-containing protein [Geitlerinema sp. PCC 9228]